MPRRATCFFCRRSIEVGEPFGVLMVYTDPRQEQPVPAPHHKACELSVTAREVARELKRAEGAKPQSLRELMRRAAHDWINDALSDDGG